jgi:hypothetical protein
VPKPTCQLNLTLEVPTAEHVERISWEAHLRPSGAGRVLLDQRLMLEAAGWRIEDKQLAAVLESVCSLPKENREKLKEFIARLVAGSIPSERSLAS